MFSYSPIVIVHKRKEWCYFLFLSIHNITKRSFTLKKNLPL